MKDSARQAAIAAGLPIYFSPKPCPKGHVGFHYIAGACQICARELSTKNNKKKQAQDPISIARRARAECRREAILAGATRYSSGQPCRNGHMAERYVSTGECIECLKKHVPTKERKRQTMLRFHAKKKIVDPTYVARKAREYKARYPYKARIDKMLKTAQRHAKIDKVRLDFGVDLLKKLLDEACKIPGIVIDPFSVRTASLDKKDVKLPISKNNIQIVPRWYNMAKQDWDEQDFIAAMAEYGFKQM